MFKKAVILGLAMFFIISLSGCATARKQNELEIQGLKNQISVLESQVQSKDEEINSLKEQLAKAPEVKEQPEQAVAKKRIVYPVKSRPNIRQVQIALKNAGFDPGSIDGKMGNQTRIAIKSFQKAHDLPANGKMGRKTWDLLREYLYKKLK